MITIIKHRNIDQLSIQYNNNYKTTHRIVGYSCFGVFHYLVLQER